MVYINGIQQNNHVKVKTVVSNKFEVPDYSNMYYEGADPNCIGYFMLKAEDGLYYTHNNGTAYAGSSAIYRLKDTHFELCTYKWNDSANTSLSSYYYFNYNNKIYRVPINLSNTVSGAITLLRTDLIDGNYEANIWESISTLRKSYAEENFSCFTEYNNELLFKYKKKESSDPTVYSYNIYSLNVSTGEYTLKYTLPSEYTLNNEGFAWFGIFDGNLYGVGSTSLPNELSPRARSIYQLVNNQWVKLSVELPPLSTDYSSTIYYYVPVGKKFYRLNWQGGLTVSNYYYNKETKVWKKMKNLLLDGNARHGYLAAPVNNKLWIFQGGYGNSSNQTMTKNISEYNHQTDTWEDATINLYKIVT